MRVIKIGDILVLKRDKDGFPYQKARVKNIRRCENPFNKYRFKGIHPKGKLYDWKGQFRPCETESTMYLDHEVYNKWSNGWIYHATMVMPVRPKSTKKES